MLTEKHWSSSVLKSSSWFLSPLSLLVNSEAFFFNGQKPYVFCINVFDLPDRGYLLLDWAALLSPSRVAPHVLVDGSSIASHAPFYWCNGTEFSSSLHYIGPLSSPPHHTPPSLQLCKFEPFRSLYSLPSFTEIGNPSVAGGGRSRHRHETLLFSSTLLWGTGGHQETDLACCASPGFWLLNV